MRNTTSLFLEKGCRALTMDEVASANGMSKRTLYEMFEDKAKLLEECIKFLHERSMEEMERELVASENVVRWFINSLEKKVRDKMGYYYEFFSEVKRYYPEVFMNVVIMVNKRHCELLERIIRRGQQEELFLPESVVNAGNLSLMLFELSVAVSDKAARDYLAMERKTDALMLYLIRGISTAKGIAIIDGYLNRNNSIMNQR